MALSAKKKKTIQNKIDTHQFEVEDLLKLAAEGDASDIEFLQMLERENHWSFGGKNPDDTLSIPFKHWNRVVCTYLKSGYTGLIALAKDDPKYFYFVIALLENFKTQESVEAILDIDPKLIADPSSRWEKARRVANAINLILSFKGRPKISNGTERNIRDFLHKSLQVATKPDDVSIILCCLRGVGDVKSIDRIKKLTPLKEPYLGLEKSVIRQIEKRLETESSGR